MEQSDLAKIKLLSIKVKKHPETGKGYIYLHGEVGDDHTTFDEGQSIWTSFLVFYDPVCALAQTVKGTFYEITSEEDELPKKLDVLNKVAKKFDIMPRLSKI